MFCSRPVQVSKGFRIGDQVLWSEFGQALYQLPPRKSSGKIQVFRMPGQDPLKNSTIARRCQAQPRAGFRGALPLNADRPDW